MSGLVEVTDKTNNVTIEVGANPDGKTLQISFIRFEKVAVSVSLTVPKKNSVEALRSFITDVYVNEDVLANLLKEALRQL